MVKKSFNDIRKKINERWRSKKTNHKKELFISEDFQVEFNPINIYFVSRILFKSISDTILKKRLQERFKELKELFLKNKKLVLTGLSNKKVEESPEYLLKYYLIECGDRYAIKIYEDLDKRLTQKRGDIKGKWRNEEVIIEVEKSDKDFIKHKHTINEKGEISNRKIDLVFTLPPKKIELPIPVIYADEKHYKKWLEKKHRFRILKDILFFYVYEMLRRKNKLMILESRDLYNDENIDLNSIIGTPKWFSYNLLNIVSVVVRDNINKRDLTQYGSPQDLIGGIDKEIKIKLDLFKKGVS